MPRESDAVDPEQLEPVDNINTLRMLIDSLGDSAPEVAQLRTVLNSLIARESVSDSPEVAAVATRLQSIYVDPINPELRRSKLKQILAEYIQVNPLQSLLNLVRYFEVLDFYSFYLDFIKNGGDASWLMFPIEYYTEVFICLYEVISQNPEKLREIIDFANEESTKSSVNSNTHLDLTSMSLPEPFPVAKKFTDFIQRYMEDPSEPTLKGNKRAKFNMLEKEFSRISRLIYGDNYEVICTSGTTNAFKLGLQKAGRRVVFGNSEYPPMYHAVDPEQREMIYYSSQTQLIDAVYDISRQDTDKPRTLLISSTPRSGDKNLVINPRNISRAVDCVPDSQRLHLWIDASQDGRLIYDGDVIFMGKKLGGTNAGIVLVRKGMHDSEQLSRYLKENSGYSELSMARSMASLYLLWQRQILPMQSLVDSPKIYIESLTHQPEVAQAVAASTARNLAIDKLESEVADGSDEFRSDPILSQHFQIDTSFSALGGNQDNYDFHDPHSLSHGSPRSFRFDGILRVFPRRNSPVFNQLDTLQSLLSQKYAVEVNFESTKSVNTAKLYLQALQGDSSALNQLRHFEGNSVTSRLRTAFAKLNIFANEDTADKSIMDEANVFLEGVPSDSVVMPRPIRNFGSLTKEELIKDLENFIIANNYYRIRVAASDKTGTYKEFIRRLGLATKELLTQ